MNDALKSIYIKMLYFAKRQVLQHDNIIEIQIRVQTFHEELGMWKEDLRIDNYSIEDNEIMIGFKYPMKRP
jgi:hypothetical protein